MEIKQETQISTKVSIPKNASFEEMQDILKTSLANPEFILDEQVYKNFISLNDVEKDNKVKSIKILGPLYEQYKGKEDKESIKRKRELNQICAFILFMPEEMELVNAQESPDFIVKINGDKIGIELTSFYDSGMVSAISIAEAICKQTEDSLRIENAHANILFNVEFDYEEMFLLKKSNAANELTNYLKHSDRNATDLRPKFLKRLVTTENSEMQVKLLESYYKKTFKTSEIDDLIRQKESKIEAYKLNTGLSLQWLLVTVDGQSESSNFTVTPELLPQRKFLFDKIFFFDEGKGICLSAPPPKK